MEAMAVAISPNTGAHSERGGFCPSDVDECWSAWRANCGPASLAAVLGRNVGNVRGLFPQFPARPWTTVDDMLDALRHAGVEHEQQAGLPFVGLVLVQLTGPWMKARHPGAHMRHSHWVGVKDGRFYDVNWAMWMAWEVWGVVAFAGLRWHDSRIEGWKIRTVISIEDPDAGRE